MTKKDCPICKKDTEQAYIGKFDNRVWGIGDYGSYFICRECRNRIYYPVMERIGNMLTKGET